MLTTLLIVALTSATSATARAASTDPVERLYLPNITKTLGGPDGWTTTIAVQNAGAAPTAMQLRLYRFSHGTEAGSFESPVLAPGRQWIFDPFAYTTLDDDAQYSAVIETSGHAAAVAVASSAAASMSYTAARTASSSVFLPRVSCQPDGWVTPIIVQNAGDATTSASLALFSEDGSPVAEADLGPLLPGRSAVALPCRSDLDAGVYSATVQGPSGARLIAVVNEHSAVGARSYPGIAGGAGSVFLPNVTKFLGGVGGWSTPFALLNVGDASAVVRLTFRALGSGEVALGVGPISLSHHQRYAVDVRALSALPAGQYAVTIAAEGPARLVALVDETEDASGTSMAYVGAGDGGPTAYLPLVQKSDGDARWSSPVIAQNVGASPANLTLTLFDPKGGVASQRSFVAVAPGASVAYDPRSDPRLPAGRYAAIVQGSGPIAAVVNHSTGSGAHRAFAYAATAGDAVPIVAAPFRLALETVGGFDFVVVPGTRADTYVQLTAALDPAVVSKAVDEDIRDLERDFSHRLVRRPQVYVFASAADFHAGLQAVLGGEGSVDPGLGVFVAKTARIGVDWGLGGTVGLGKLRHELTHLIVSEIVGADADFPAWLNEGLARLEEYGAKGGAFLEIRDRYDATSMRAAGRLFSLAQLAPQAAWLERIDTPAGRYEYAVAGQAVHFLREDLGTEGIVRLLELLRGGTSVADAYSRLSGRAFAAFASAFPDRVGGLAPRGPGIAAAPGPGDDGLAFLLYGFGPSAGLAYTIIFNGIEQTRAGFESSTDSYGRADHLVAAGSLPGIYTITVETANGATLRSSASFPVSAASSTDGMKETMR